MATWFRHPLPGGRGHVWGIPHGNCCRADCSCKPCVDHHSAKRGARVSRRLGAVASVSGCQSFAAVVLTLPRDSQPRTKARLAELRRRARKALRLWIERRHPWMDPGAWEIGTVDTWHYEGDKRPGVWMPHIHLELPLVARQRSTGRWRRLRYKAEQEHLTELGQLWADAAGLRLGRAVVHYAWRKLDTERGRHRVRYDFRHFERWQSKGRRTIWAGVLGPRHLAAEEIKAAELEAEESEPEHDPMSCPACGEIGTVIVRLPFGESYQCVHGDVDVSPRAREGPEREGHYEQGD